MWVEVAGYCRREEMVEKGDAGGIKEPAPEAVVPQKCVIQQSEGEPTEEGGLLESGLNQDGLGA